MDKFWHAAISFGATLFFGLILGPYPAALLVFAVGVGKEIDDYHTPGRYCEWGDILANTVGIILAAGGLKWFMSV